MLGRKRNDAEDGQLGDLEHGDSVPAPNVGFGRVLSLAKPEAGGLVISSTPEQKSEALSVKNTILEIFLIVIVGSVCTALRAWLFSSASERVVARLRKNLLSHLVGQEIAFFDITRTGELLSRLSEDTQIIKNAATTNLSEALRNLATAFVGLGFMFQTSWKLTYLSKLHRELSHKTQAAAALASSIAEETFGAIRTVRSFAQEDYEISRYSEKVDETLKLGLGQALLHPSILYSLTVGSSVSGLSGLYTVAMKAAGPSRNFSALGSHIVHAKIRKPMSIG
ncbi:hypothetical protein HAX54_024097 [Datura stramonium]|uniref:ABC transmembrane type-1 domain-containing protein n=1 Tax=Datura stramonium TaxID=4076 RepID=A0ABS8UXE5_DATST|nr:hypothetical protein [Datura stramonium]